MGNAQITIHHPTSLRIHSPTLEWGKVIPGSNTTFRISKRDGCWTGCGGYVLISRDVKESKWTYSFKNTSKFDIRCSLTGTGSAKPRVSTTAGDQVVAEGNICAKLLEFGMTWEEARESIVLVNCEVSDDYRHSELYAYVPYNGNSGKDYFETKWTRNDLNLDFEERWRDSVCEKVITITTDKMVQGTTLEGFETLKVENRERMLRE